MSENKVRTRKIRTAGIHNLESLIFKYERLIEDNNGFAEIREIETLDTLRACSEEIHRLNLKLNKACSALKLFCEFSKEAELLLEENAR